jgi:hypothetical protein
MNKLPDSPLVIGVTTCKTKKINHPLDLVMC